MGDEIELVSDGDGVALFGDPAAVERFLSTAGVPSKEISLPSLSSALTAGSLAATAGSAVAANSGRWVKLTKESAEALKLGKAMTGSSNGVSRAIATTKNGKVTKVLEFANQGSLKTLLTNPALLAGAAGIMAQLAMQQTMAEITEYLAVIDEKVDDVLRAQKDAAIAEMVGVGLVLDDAMLKREHVGRVSDVTWSSLHGAAQTIAATQAYALRQLDAVATKLEKNRKIPDLAHTAQSAEKDVQEWLAVLARCFQLQDGLDILELDRVLDSSPEDVDRHREGLRAARERRRTEIATATHRLLERMEEAASLANEKVLLHPVAAQQVVRSGNEVGTDVDEFHQRLGIPQRGQALEARRWGDAVGEVVEDARSTVGDAKDAVLQTAGAGAASAARFGSEAVANMKIAGRGLTQRLGERLPRRGAPGGVREYSQTYPELTED